MAISLFERVTAALFGGRDAGTDDPAERQLVVDMVELVVEAVEPRCRLTTRYQEKLEGPIRKTIAYLREIGRDGLEPILLTRAAWGDDPRLTRRVARSGGASFSAWRRSRCPASWRSI